VTWLTGLVGMGVAAFIGIVSSFVPAWNAARTNILDSLRYSG
jgi:ABC-type antimicrobial peptide transport system permease subunit